ncbi:MAG: Molecular chaperone (small heat shock protein) [Moraxellaceae bacterium]|jgi:HSP20 family protein|nr:Molecular chaperone (small heat shock protein) [Moraxellaceae bacterium]
MAQTRWNPFREMEEILDRYTRAMGGHSQLPATSGDREALSRPDWMPAVDILERKDRYVLKVELPEVKKEDVKVAVDNGVLTISGERHMEVDDEDQGSQHRRVERLYGSFSRSFTLPEEADENGIDASYKDGMLTLSIPKIAKPEPRAIEVKVH